ncbi:MAG TPA: enoyl-CoA hydratase/isomerase family protein, partial [Mycobacteriales bacterium]|nr:enoyl-CoA hydratase/isomerase family protein [Mycobacteriales bacterium]
MSDLVVSHEGGVLRLHMNREAKRNALNGAVLDGMLAALRDPGDARVVLITSEGKVFCSGADLVQMA